LVIINQKEKNYEIMKRGISTPPIVEKLNTKIRRSNEKFF
tara:strand:- start:355 stop:474 length:120 start_codon:yes stop_codon:yes gene_type:complete